MIPELDICVRECPLRNEHVKDAGWRIFPGPNDGHSHILYVRRSPEARPCIKCTLLRTQCGIRPLSFPTSKQVRRFFARMRARQVEIDQAVCPYYAEHFLVDANRRLASGHGGKPAGEE